MKKIVVSLALLVACNSNSVTRPEEGPGTSYPCGVWGVECPSGSCCPWGHVCGDSKAYGRFSRCSDGYCCFEGDPFYGIADHDGGPDAGPFFGRTTTPQRKPR